MKYCHKCSTSKDKSDYYRCNKSKDGLQSKCKQCEKKYKTENAQRQKELKRAHYLKNKERYNQKAREYKRKHRKRLRDKLFKERPEQKLLHYYRSRLNQIVKNKNAKTLDLVGCDAVELKRYIESKFKKGMSWDNYGRNGWHVDHIIPCAKFDMTNEEEVKQCFHYTNLQPLWAKENIKKSDKLIKNQLSIRI